MAANWELQLISSIVRNTNDGSKLFGEAQSKGITSTTLGNAEARAIWSSIDLHYSRPHNYGKIPSEQKLLEQYQYLDLPTPQEDFIDLCTYVKEMHMERKAEKAIEKFHESKKAGATNAAQELVSTLSVLCQEVTLNADVDFNEVALNETISDIATIKENKGCVGLPFPWEQLTEGTGGLNPGDFAMIYALPKSMKTWIGLVIAAHIAMTGRRVLIYSKEMNWANMRRRMACIMAKVDYTRYRKGRMSEVEELQVMEKLAWFSEECGGRIIFSALDRADGTAGGPNEVRAKMNLYKPEFVFLDSCYMLQLPNNDNPYDWKNMTAVNGQIKQIAKSTNVPILGIFQESERAALKYKGQSRGTASIAMNTNVVQDVDIAIQCIYNKHERQITLKIACGRETMLEGFTIHAHAAENFEYCSDKMWEVGCGEDDKPEKGAPPPAAVERMISTVGSMIGDIAADGEAHVVQVPSVRKHTPLVVSLKEDEDTFEDEDIDD